MKTQSDTGARFESDDGLSYLKIGEMLGGVAAFVTFVGAWIYAITTAGFVLGVALGWIPAALLAVIVAVAVRFLWGPILFIIGLGGLLIFRAVG